MSIIVKIRKCSMPRIHDNKVYQISFYTCIFSIDNKNYFSIKYSITYIFDKFTTIYLNIIRYK